MTFLLHVIVMIGNWIPGALTYTLIFGKAKILHFGPVGVTLGTSYVTFVIAQMTGSYALGILAGLVFAFLLSFLFAWLSMRLHADAFGILSLAVYLGVISVVLNWSSVTRGALGIPRIPRSPFPSELPQFAFVMALISVAWVIAMVIVERSSFGRKLHALAEQEWHASSLGIDRFKTHVLVFLLGALSAPFATVPITHYLGLLHPSDYQFVGFIFYMMIVVAGKPGSILGATLASILLVALREGIRFLPLAPAILGPVRIILFGIILFAAVWWRRDRLFPKGRTV